MSPTEAMAKYLWISFVLWLQVWLQPANSHSVMEYLPGFPGRLPFHLETGYVGVDEAEDVQLFYYFVKSHGNDKEDPLLLWFTGGPGCSALSGLIYEIGPINFEIKEYNGSLPTLVLNPYSWTQFSSIIFLDLPAGTGFSYATSPLASHRTDFKQVSHAHQFLRKWLMDHPEFVSNPVYIIGESVTGLIVPAVVEKISDGNNESFKPLINLKGYILGNAATDPRFDTNSQIPYAHGMGLISDELYESLKRSCEGEYLVIDPSNSLCLENLEAFHKCVSGIEHSHILEHLCPTDSPHVEELIGKRRYLNEDSRIFFRWEHDLPTVDCRTYEYLLAKYWVNDNNVKKALHVREGSIGKWHRCNAKLPYTYEIYSSIEYHLNLGKKGYRRLIYSGDHDMFVPFLGTLAWIRSLNYSIIEDWRPWYLQGQIAGYTRSYSNQMTFATVKGAGHTAPEYKRAESLAMFERWICREPL